MDEDDDESTQSISMDDISVEEDYTLSVTDHIPHVRNKIQPYLIILRSEIEKQTSAGENLENVFSALLNVICPIAFDVLQPEEEKLDISLDYGLIRALEYELVSVLLDTDYPFDLIEQYSKLENPSEFCGKVFNSNDLKYSCRDCGVDHTCVMCCVCFSNSIHKDHHYRMSQSGGGGCCDCGDAEAWHDGYVCTKHEKGLTAQVKTSDSLEEVKLRKRAEAMFLAIIRFAFELLIPDVQEFGPSDTEYNSVYNSTRLINPEFLKKVDESKPYALVLYNDEVHTYDDVEMMLKKSVRATVEQAKGFALVVDRTGRTILKQSDLQTCKEIQQGVIHMTEGISSFQRQRGYEDSGPIKSLVTDRRILGMQEVALRLLRRINVLTAELEIFRRAFTDACRQKRWSKNCTLAPTVKKTKLIWDWNDSENDNLMCTVEIMLLSDIYTWKNVRLTMIKTLIENYLKEYDNKLFLSRVFSKHYQEIYENVDKDDHDLKYSVSSIAVQLFTTPSIVNYLIENENILEQMFEILVERYFPCGRDGQRTFRAINKGNKNIHYALSDIEYCIGHVQNDKAKFEPFVEPFLAGISHFIELMRLFQGTDSIIFAKDEHVRYEPEWDNAITFLIQIQRVLKKIIDWSLINERCLTRIMISIQHILNTRRTEMDVPAIINSLTEFKLHERFVWGKIYHIISIDINSKKVGVHHMLSRFMTELLCRTPTVPFFCREEIILYCAEALAAQCLACQQKSGFWKRNGQSLQYTIYYYFNARIRDIMALQDIRAVQYMCSAFDSPDDFLATLLNGVGLNGQFYDQTSTKPESPIEHMLDIKNQKLMQHWLNSAENNYYILRLIGEFLLLLIRIINERFPFMSTIDTKQDLRRQLLHALAFKYEPWSKISKNFSYTCTIEELQLIEQILPDISVTREINGVKSYGIKPSLLSEWDRFYVRYENNDQSMAFGHVQSLVRNDEKAKIEMTLPKQKFEFLPKFENILDLLDCDLMTKLIKTFLTHQNSGQGIIDKCLYIIALAVQHNRAQWVAKEGILDILDKLNQSSLDTTCLPWIKEKLGATKAEEGQENDKLNMRKKKAMQRRKAMMQKLDDMSQKFIELNKEEFADKKNEDDEFYACDKELVDDFPSKKDLFNLTEKLHIEDTWTCVMCKVDQETKMEPGNEDPMVMVGFGESSATLNRCKNIQEDHKMCYNEIFHDFSYYQPIHIDSGYHVSTCGHAVHTKCLEAIKVLKDNARRNVLQNRKSWKEDQEFTCPLCYRLCNLVIPIIPKKWHIEARKMEKDKDLFSLREWMREIELELAPERRFTKKTYVVNLGTFNVDEMGTANQDRCDEMETNTKKEECELPLLASNTDEQMEYGDAGNNQDEDTDSIEDEFNDDSLDLICNRSALDSIHMFNRNFLTYNNMDGTSSQSNSFCYVLMNCERLLALTSKHVIGSLPVRRDKCLEYMLRSVLCKFEGTFATQKEKKELWNENKVVGNNLLNSFFPDCIKDRDSAPILLCDIFFYYAETIFVKKFMSSQTIKNTLIKSEHHFLRLLVVANITQVAIFSTNESINDYEANDVNLRDREESENLQILVNQLRVSAGKPVLSIGPEKLYNFIISCITPFLRCVIIFRQYLGLYAIEYLPTPLLESSNCTFETLCSALDLNHKLCDFFDANGTSLEPHAQKWINHLIKSCDRFSLKTHNIEFPYVIEIPKLVDLPIDYRTVIENSMNYKCPKSSGQSFIDHPAPAMCLICGATVCALSKCCSAVPTNITKCLKIGGATAHAVKCSKGIGLFMLIRSTNDYFSPRIDYRQYESCSGVMVMIRSKVCNTSFNLPYLDNHGEPDRGLRQGNQLLLSQAAYAEIRRMWLSHEITERIGRSQQTARNYYQQQWDNF